MTTTISTGSTDLNARMHIHDWPSDLRGWREISECQLCGLRILRLFLRSPDWVTRRVEKVEFLNERTVVRNVTVDYTTRADTLTLRHQGRLIRMLPLTIMRRKSLVSFDYVDEHGDVIPLLGLRENQAITLAIVRGWATQALDGKPLSDEVARCIDDLVCGDQEELNDSILHFEGRKGAFGHLWRDEPFRMLVERLTDNFICFIPDDQQVGSRRVVKFSYHEPLTLRTRNSGYRRICTTCKRPQPDGLFPYLGLGHLKHRECDKAPGVPRYEEEGPLPRRNPRALLSGLGLLPTKIRFPVPAAELGVSFHFEISAPPQIQMLEASLLAGRPNERRPSTLSRDGRQRGTRIDRDPNDPPKPPIPSYDVIRSGVSTVDLHVADVPFGSLSRAQVVLRPTAAGWLTSAAAATWLVSLVLLVSWLSKGVSSEVAATLMITFVAGIVALVVRPDPHAMVTRLLTPLRWMTASSAALALAASLVYAFHKSDPGVHQAHERDWLEALFSASLIPMIIVTIALLLAVRRAPAETSKARSPWEQRRAQGNSKDSLVFWGTDHITFVKYLRRATLPYDCALKRLKFSGPAVRVASIEGARQSFEWTDALMDVCLKRLPKGEITLPPTYRSNGGSIAGR